MKIDRINRMHELLKEVHNISINDLCDTFNVSKNTIRRDIAELEEKGIIRKVYGGIVLNERQQEPEPFSLRETRNADAKKRIARLAAGFVKDGDVIYIDSGTTTMHMIPFLTEKQHLTIVTASVHVINIASSFANLNIIATGGSLFMPSKAFVGPSVLQCLRQYNISKIFLASTGISLAHGATNASPLECEIKRCLIEKPCPHYLLVDSSKFGVASLMSYCALKDLDCLITDEMPPEKYRIYCKENGVQLVTPD
ncbi:DeoR/GlpR family DNA-binding transcription regulator [Mitsuokella sp. oral taxon 131]|uniref:DeoR/GlpR family DNA-binding transcription regulator n=1 Tax=Mitsuokella sp. oral taxon 131 TaxID=1321780 RepID=UPI0003FCC8A4|nr:DeoR/GlpR family DNA-binding transcription regulator [Mitsuokella sp. oral taxon 131]